MDTSSRLFCLFMHIHATRRTRSPRPRRRIDRAFGRVSHLAAECRSIWFARATNGHPSRRTQRVPAYPQEDVRPIGGSSTESRPAWSRPCPGHPAPRSEHHSCEYNNSNNYRAAAASCSGEGFFGGLDGRRPSPHTG